MDALSHHWVLGPLSRFAQMFAWLTPRSAHHVASHLFSMLFQSTWSRFFIRPYCWFHYRGTDYLQNFAPASGRASYLSFQDFFTRKLKRPITASHGSVWPCEGVLCESGVVSTGMKTIVKGDRRFVDVVFDEPAGTVPIGYHYSNVFLHNKNYHRIHAPIGGVIESIKRIPGKLFILRPYLNGHNPSFPAMFNERVNLRIRDDKGNKWFASIVGGPGVATIELADGCAMGRRVLAGAELAIFRLGSTCCMASPFANSLKVGSKVAAGMKYGD